MSFKKTLFVFSVALCLCSHSGIFVSADSPKKSAGFLEDDELSQALSALDADEEAPVPIYSPQAKEVSVPKPSKTNLLEALKPQDVQMAAEEETIPLNVTEFGAKGKRAKARSMGNMGTAYSMVENFADMQTALLNASRDIEVEGIWNKDHFEFSGFPGAVIQSQTVKFTAEDRKVISVKILPQHIYQLRFDQVPVFSNLKLEYNLSDGSGAKTPNYMFFRIMVGKYELKRLQVSSKDPWLKQSLKMGVISFLNQPVPVTFEFATSQASGLTFSFIPETD